MEARQRKKLNETDRTEGAELMEVSHEEESEALLYWFVDGGCQSVCVWTSPSDRTGLDMTGSTGILMFGLLF
ncbi:hypothetical protein AOLI_G00192550 [Acnodon oligacanthus]